MDEFNNPNVEPNQEKSQPNQENAQPNQENQQYQQQQYNQQYSYNQHQPYEQQYQQQYQQQQYNQGVYYEQKSKVAAGVLGILLGCFGVHNFYLGYTGKAIAQLLITVLTCGVGAAVTSIWGLIEGILILTGSIAIDGKGIPLKD